MFDILSTYHLLPFQGVAVALPIYFATKRYLLSHAEIGGE
jgi:hypothetical protein